MTTDKNPDDLLRNLLMQFKGASEKTIFDAFQGAITDDQRYLPPIIAYWFRHHYKNIEYVEIGEHSAAVLPRERVQAEPSARVTTSVRTPIPPEVKQRERNEIEQFKNHVRRGLTMAFVMPNGEELRNCRVKYLRGIGGVFTTLTRGLPDNAIIGKHRTDEALENIQKRMGLNA